MPEQIQFVFFGGEPLGVPALAALEQAGLRPALVVCNPDRPVGRKQVLTPPPVKVWAEEYGIEVYQPASYRDEGPRAKLAAQEWDLFVVVAYNFILPKWLIELPQHGTLNLHPSLLPLLRGASPIRSAILRNQPEAVGVTIIQMDEQMDHGTILAQEAHPIPETEWPPAGPALDAALAEHGGQLLTETIPAWCAGAIAPQEQDHTAATYCGKLTKAESEVVLDPTHLPTGPEAERIWRTFQAFRGLSDIYFVHADTRIKITDAKRTASGAFEPITVVPAGKPPCSFAAYRESLR